MKCTPVVVAMLAGALALPPNLAVAGPQEAASANQKPTEVPTFGVGTAAVTLDIVVRDKKGRAVRDLKASDFEVFEDGVKQALDSFQVFGKPLDEGAEQPNAAPAPAPSAAAPTPAAEPENRPQIIAFIFDRLSAAARSLAHKAALT